VSWCEAQQHEVVAVGGTEEAGHGIREDPAVPDPLLGRQVGDHLDVTADVGLALRLEHQRRLRVDAQVARFAGGGASADPDRLPVERRPDLRDVRAAVGPHRGDVGMAAQMCGNVSPLHRRRP
jgi:hypothetical protein